jgi:flagellar hook-associated protein 2
MAASFQAGGIASGLDTNSIVDSLVKLRSQPLTLLLKRQSAAKTQISLLGDITSKLVALKDAARGLSTGGVLGARVTSTNSSFSAAPGTNAVAGSYSVQVQSLAQPAKARSQAFAAGETVQGATLALRVQGTDYSVTIADGATLEDAATAIRQSGAPVSAVVLDNGTSRYLSVTARDTGYPLAGVAGDALAITQTLTGSAGKALGATVFQQARNASVTVDGLVFTRQGNTVADAVPGTTLTLSAEGGAGETLSVAYDTEATQAKLQRFVDAYNAVIGLVQKQLSVKPEDDRESMLAGDSSIRSLQSQLQLLTASTVPGLVNVRSLADLGVKTGRDGSLQIDAATLGKAIARDAGAVNSLFATATTGLGALATTLADNFTRAGDGVLTARSSSLDRKVKSMGDEATRLQAQIDRYRSTLVAQFTAMEKTVSALKASGSFLAQQLSSTSSK